MSQIMIYTTSTGKNLPMALDIMEMDPKHIVSDRTITIGECQKCKMFGKGGGCPPFAPDFNKTYKDKYKYGYIVIITIPIERWMSDKHKAIPNPMSGAFLVLNFMQVVMKPIETKMTKILSLFDGKVLSAGYCGACHKCVVKQGQPCAKPSERMFSLESTGILVSDTLKNVGFAPLDWVRYRDKYVPRYTKRVMLLLCNKSGIQSNILEGIKSIKGLTLI